MQPFFPDDTQIEWVGVSLTETGTFEDGTVEDDPEPISLVPIDCPNDYCGTIQRRMRVYLRAFNLFMLHYLFLFLPLLPII